MPDRYIHILKKQKKASLLPNHSLEKRVNGTFLPLTQCIKQYKKIYICEIKFVTWQSDGMDDDDVYLISKSL